MHTQSGLIGYQRCLPGGRFLDAARLKSGRHQKQALLQKHFFKRRWEPHFFIFYFIPPPFIWWAAAATAWGLVELRIVFATFLGGLKRNLHEVVRSVTGGVTWMQLGRGQPWREHPRRPIGSRGEVRVLRGPPALLQPGSLCGDPPDRGDHLAAVGLRTEPTTGHM